MLNTAQLAELLAADPLRAAVLCDYDGTLAPIVDDPAAAWPEPNTTAVLDKLTALVGRVAIVTGRPAAEIVRFLKPNSSVVIAGSYGRELDDTTSSVDFKKLAVEAHELIPDINIETKPHGVALHYRTNPGAQQRARNVAEELAARNGLQIREGKMVYELVDAATTKGIAVATVLSGFDRAIFIGDDLADIEAFESAKAAVALCANVAVNSDEAPAELLRKADHIVVGPAGVVALLQEIATAIGDVNNR